MNAIETRSKSSHRFMAAALGVAILGAGAALTATATPARADTWVYDGGGHRVLVRDRYYAPPPVYYTPGYYYGYPGYYGRPYAYPPYAGIGVGVPGFHVGIGF